LPSTSRKKHWEVVDEEDDEDDENEEGELSDVEDGGTTKVEAGELPPSYEDYDYEDYSSDEELQLDKFGNIISKNEDDTIDEESALDAFGNIVI